MRILALIPARGGSKRCPGKNIRLLGDKPLIVWSIDVAKEISEICDILVSTDDHEIATVSKNAGAFVPWLRPSFLANDNATSVDAALHALDWYENKIRPVDALLLLQPTSPFRTVDTINNGVKIFSSFAACSVVGVSLTHDHPSWMFTIENNRLISCFDNNGLAVRSQDLSSVYIVNGSFYLISPDSFRKCKTFFPNGTIPLVINSRKEVIDIDDEYDFAVAQCFARRDV